MKMSVIDDGRTVREILGQPLPFQNLPVVAPSQKASHEFQNFRFNLVHLALSARNQHVPNTVPSLTDLRPILTARARAAQAEAQPISSAHAVPALTGKPLDAVPPVKRLKKHTDTLPNLRPGDKRRAC